MKHLESSFFYKMNFKNMLSITLLILTQVIALPESDMRKFENTLQEIGDSMNAISPGSVKMPEPKMEQIMEMANNILAAVRAKPSSTLVPSPTPMPLIKL